MKTSVVIPVYNEEKFIKNCLDSLMNQEEKADEIIVVDNNCTDNTVEIVKKYKNIIVIKEKKQGITHARNAGFNAATSDIILRTDADTILPKDWIKKIKNDFARNKDIVAVTTYFYIFDTPFIDKSLIPAKMYFDIAKLILKHPSLVGYSMAVRKNIWNKVKNELCLDDSKVHEDIDLGIHILKYGKIFLDRSLAVRMSGRRIKHNPLSFFGEYPSRLMQMLKSHRHLF